MSVIENVKAALSPKRLNQDARLAPQMRQRLTIAQQALTELRQRHGEHVMALELAEDGADKRMVEYREAVSKAEQRVIDLESAVSVAEETDSAAIQQSVARKREADIRSVTQRLARMHSSFIKVRSHVENLATEYNALREMGAELREYVVANRLPWEGSKFDPKTGQYFQGHESGETTMVSLDRLMWHVRLEMLRAGHGPASASDGEYHSRLPGALSFADAEQVLRVDPRDSSDMPLRGDGGLHDHDAAARGENGEFGAVKPIDQIFDRQRKRLLALVKGDTALPIASPPELFLGTAPAAAEPPRVDTKSLRALPTVTPKNTTAPSVDGTVKRQAEDPVVATFGIEAWDRFCERKYGANHWNVPPDRWTEYVADCDAARLAGKIPGDGDDNA